ncbi:MAG: sulfotransferase [Proteobacteria bacterium]|nr:sulfotransferase [Pseudomonadota bacterium]
MTSAYTSTALRLVQMRRPSEAILLLEEALNIHRTDTTALHLLADLLLQAGRVADVAARYQVAATLLPDNVSIRTGYAHAALLQGDAEEALRQLERILELDPNIADQDGWLGPMLRSTADTDRRCEILQALSDRWPSHTGLLRLCAEACEDAEWPAQARAVLERLRTATPHDPYPLVELGRLAISLGDSQQATTHFSDALAIDPNYSAALWHSAQLDKGRIDEAMAQRADRLLLVEQDPNALAGLHDLLARYHDGAGRYARAAWHMHTTNALKASLVPERARYDKRRHESDINATISEYNATWLDNLEGAGSPDRRPVFVIGLPRSGTTLLEQILASHPDIMGAGETGLASASLRRALTSSGGRHSKLHPDAIREAAEWHVHQLEQRQMRLAPDQRGLRIIDKMPDNYMLAAWLRVAFPNAVLIHCLRDPRDVALSCWRTQFAAVPWSFDLHDIAHRIAQHRRIMRHWRSLFRDRLIDVRFEELVTNPESGIRRALTAMDCQWCSDMLAFHGRKGYVASASMRQVRDPLNASGVGRWLHYEDVLRPVLDALNEIALSDRSADQSVDAT